MRKSLIALTVALAAAATTVTPAQAKGKGFGVGLGVGLLVGGALLHHHHHHHRPRTVIVPTRPVVVQPSQAQPVAAPIARYDDGAGRAYDVASKTWFDGRDRCWTGAQGWSFRGGSWFYGASAWYESAGQWITNAAAPPTQVDCATVPVFASRMPARGTVAPVVTPTSIDSPAEEPKLSPEAAERMRAALAEGHTPGLR